MVITHRRVAPASETGCRPPTLAQLGTAPSVVRMGLAGLQRNQVLLQDLVANSLHVLAHPRGPASAAGWLLLQRVGRQLQSSVQLGSAPQDRVKAPSQRLWRL